ncbi:protein phosphatase 2C domain-containing protein [Bacillus sp. DJP31]|uniref:protein phosphatase 2C domain-containing protein n=1 Tax=Bacillus sp. DJP31 TaxID=3409789 RepID=UPI003BB65715
MESNIKTEFSWVGSDANYLDEPNIEIVNDVVIGRFGGNSKAGQYKNEDGCLVWTSKEYDWELAILLDAHKTAESAELVVQTFEQEKINIQTLLKLPVNEAFKKMDTYILDIFQNPNFLIACKNVTGETACLIVLRKKQYLWWFSIGDNVLYLFHPDLVKLGQYQLSQRNYYEWVGQVNTFELSVPCYSTGKRELRTGENHIFLTTDGLLECPNTNFKDPREIIKRFTNSSIEHGVEELFIEIVKKNVRDSTTIVTWKVNNIEQASLPSDL